jgi:hypothetical protein
MAERLAVVLMDHRKVGDFGLATSSLAAAVEPSELVPHVIMADAEMTLGSCVFVLHIRYPQSRR